MPATRNRRLTSHPLHLGVRHQGKHNAIKRWMEKCNAHTEETEQQRLPLWVLLVLHREGCPDSAEICLPGPASVVTIFWDCQCYTATTLKAGT